MTYLNIARVAAAALALSAVPALAGEGNGPSYPGYVVPDVAITTGTLGNAAGTYGGQPTVGIAIPGTINSNSNSAGEPEPVNSLPRGFEDGMPGQMRQQELQRYRVTHQ